MVSVKYAHSTILSLSIVKLCINKNTYRRRSIKYGLVKKNKKKKEEIYEVNYYINEIRTFERERLSFQRLNYVSAA